MTADMPANEIVIFDAATMSSECVIALCQAAIGLRDGLLHIDTKGGTGSPGVFIKGAWDLSGCNRVSLELVLLDQKGELPLTVRLENPDAVAEKQQGVAVQRIRLTGHSANTCEVALQEYLPNAREINSKLRGLRRGPFPTPTGAAPDLDPARIVGLAIYIDKPKLDWHWAVKRIVAHPGPLPEVAPWMRLPADQFFPIIDEYGQFRHREWPGKVHSDEDLTKAIETERAELAAHPGPDGWDKYGGWAAGPKLEATGRFRAEKVDGKWWLVDPEGHLWWSHGPVRVNPSTSVTPLDGREFYFTNLPAPDSPFALFYTTHDELLWPYYVARGIKRTYDFSSANAFRKYGADWRARFADLAHQRLRSWGMNTIANSSDRSICLLDRTPYCDRIDLKSPDLAGAHLGWWRFKDPFHLEFRTALRRQLLERKHELDDPWCFGLFVDNEISWGDETSLAEWTLLSPPTQPAKLEFIRRLREKYGTIEALNAAWTASFDSWDALGQSQQAPPAGARADCIDFSTALVEAYFRNVREEFKSVAPDLLYMGCRFAGSTKTAVQIAARYCDVISYNIYRHSLDGFKLPEGVDKPVIVGEFHFGALDRGPFDPSLIQVADQDARAQAYVTYITSALRHPNFVGAHWHQFGEEPTGGRFDGENMQNGLVDVCDNPYPETVAGIRQVGYRMYEIRSGK
jgi:hypothetical protein